MLDISKRKIDISCENCNRNIRISLQQVANEEVITCGCGTRIQLQDSKGSAKKGIRDINKAFKNLENTLKSFGK